MKKFLLLCLFLFLPKSASAASYWWDGGGSTNNWSEAANWSSDIVPTSVDSVSFSASSTKDATIDNAFQGIVTTFTISSTYSGTITQMRAITSTGAFSQAAGTFVGATSTTGTIIFSSTWTLSGGTFRAPVATSSFAGNFTQSAGTFNHSSGTVKFAAALTVDVPSSINFYNLVIDSGGISLVSFSSADRWYVYNNLSLVQGYIDAVSNARIEMLGQAGVTTSLFHQANYSGQTGLIMVTGTNPIAVNLTGTASANVGDISALTINNPNALVTVSGTGGTIDFESTFTFTTGTFVGPTGGTGLNFASTFSCTGGTISAGSGSVAFVGAATFGGCAYTGGVSSTLTEAYSSTVTVSGGSWTKATGSVSLASTLTISAGTYNATPATTTFTSGGFIHSSGVGTFNHSSGTFKFGESGGLSIDLGSSATTENFYNFVEDMTGISALTITNGKVAIYGNLTLTEGYLSGSAANRLEMIGQPGVTTTLYQDANYSGESGGFVTVTGTNPILVSLNPSASVNVGDMTSFTVNNPNALVVVNGSSGSLDLDGAFIFASGTFRGPASGVTLNLKSTFTCSGGTFDAGSGTVTVTGAATFSGCAYSGSAGAAVETYTSTFSMSAGTWAKTGSSTLYSNTYSLSGGTYTAGPSTTFSSTYTHTAGGTFVANAGLVKFTSGASSVDVATTETFYDVDIVKTSAAALTVTSGDTLVVAHTLYLNDGTVATGNIEAQGDVVLGSTFDAGSTAVLVFGGGNNQTFTLSTTTIYDGDIIIRKTSTSSVTALGSALVLNASSQDLTISTGTLYLSGNNLTVNGTSGTFIVSASGTLKLNGNETITTNVGYPLFRTGSTAEYSGTSTYAVQPFTYHNLTLSGSGTYTLATNTILGGNLTLVSASGTLGLGSYNVTINSTNTYSNAGTLRLSGNETINFSINPNVGTVEYVGTSTYNSLPAGNSYNNLIFSGAGVWRQNAAVAINGNVIIATSSALQSQGYDVTLGGNWTNNGIYSGGGNTTTFNGVNQIILGTTTFSTFAKNVTTTADTLYFGAGQTQTVTGIFAVSGVSGALLSLRSTVTDTQWVLVAPSTLAIEYLDVQDSNNTGVTIAAAGLNSIDRGNNTGWRFTSSGNGGGFSPPLQSYTPPALVVETPSSIPPPVVVPPTTVPVTSTPITPVVPDDVPLVVVIPEPVVNVPIPIDTTMGVGSQVEVFTRLVRFGSVHTEVKLLQKYLNKHGFVVATRGAGSVGKETTYFGVATRNALLRFQKTHKLKQTGQVDAATRKMLNTAIKLVVEDPNQSELAISEDIPAVVLAEKIVVAGFNRDLKFGDVHADVKKLQLFLNANGFVVATRWAGSPGKETNVYGVNTQAAVKRFQEAYAEEILVPKKLTRGTGTFSIYTRAVVNRLLLVTP